MSSYSTPQDQGKETVSDSSPDSHADRFVLPASFAQIRLWLLDKLEPEQSAYNVPFAIRVRGALKINILDLSLQELIARHEILRTTLAEDNAGTPIQVVAARQEFKLRVIDLRNVSEDQREDQARSDVIEQTRLPFDLSQGPLFRASLFRMADDDHILSFA